VTIYNANVTLENNSEDKELNNFDLLDIFKIIDIRPHVVDIVPSQVIQFNARCDPEMAQRRMHSVRRANGFTTKELRIYVEES